MSLSDIEALAANGHFQEALRQARRTLDADPNCVDAWSLICRLELSLKHYDAALHLAQHLCTLAPESGQAWYVLGRTLRATNETAGAIDCFRRAIRLEPGNTKFHLSLGVALRAVGKTDEAIATYRQALLVDPANLAARQNLLNAMQDLARHGVGQAHAMPDSTHEPHKEWARQALSSFEAGNYADSLRAATIALEHSRADVSLLEVAAAAAVNTQSAALAVDHYERLAAVAPGHHAVRDGLLGGFHLATISGKRDDVNRYAASLLKYERNSNVVEVLRLADSLVLPAINRSRNAILDSRVSYEHGLDALIDREVRLPGDFRMSIIPSFFLAYHGECDRDLMIKAARIWNTSLSSLRHSAPHCSSAKRKSGRIRIGLISKFFYQHSIGKTTEGLLRHFDRGSFEVFLLRLVPGTCDETTRRMQQAADHYVEISSDVFRDKSAEKIGALELDVLFFQDIGMEPSSYFLALSRLAPVQCVSFGHPNTTGIPTMDYFVTNDLYETETSAAHYSEALFPLRNLPTLAYYFRPIRRGPARTRRQLGLPEAGALYVCPQTLFKLHPDFDEILRGILDRDATGHVILVRGQNLHWYDELHARLDVALGTASRRIVSVGMLPQEGFLDLLAICDVMLDTVHFNGMNSSLEAFSVGLPIVTLPTKLQRGRHTQAMYKKMGITDGIAADAADYVDIAVRLGTDHDFNTSMRRTIEARCSILFEDISVVREFERFFRFALDQKRI